MTRITATFKTDDVNNVFETTVFEFDGEVEVNNSSDSIIIGAKKEEATGLDLPFAIIVKQNLLYLLIEDDDIST